MHYLKGTKAQKERLMQEHREVNDNIERIWTIRNDHMVHNLPTQYAFVLVCCYSQGVLIQFAVITTLQNSSMCFVPALALTLSNLGGKPTVMHVVGSAMDIF